MNQSYVQVAPRGTNIENTEAAGEESEQDGGLPIACMQERRIDSFKSYGSLTGGKISALKRNEFYSDVHKKQGIFEAKLSKRLVLEKVLLEPAPEQGKTRVERKGIASSTLLERKRGSERCERQTKRHSKEQCKSPSTRTVNNPPQQGGSSHYIASEKVFSKKQIKLTSPECKAKSCVKRPLDMKSSKGTYINHKIYI